jgi:homoprotocatechuate degradation regulator HpaR
MNNISDETAKRHSLNDDHQGNGASLSSRQLPVLLHRTREALAVHFRKVFIQHDLTDPQWRVLRILSHSDESDVAGLAQQSYLMGPSLSRILRDLTARRLIVRRASATDARRFFHSLTPRGRRLLEKVSPAFNPVYEEIEKRFGIDRIQDLNSLLAEFLLAIQFPAPESTAQSSAASIVNGGRHSKRESNAAFGSGVKYVHDRKRPG